MHSFKTLTVLLVGLPFLMALCVDGKSKKSKGKAARGTRSWSSSGGDFWFWAYTFNQLNWPDTPMSMEEFGRSSVEIMWTNKPDNMSAAICIQGSWFVKNYDLISATMRTSYFKKTWFGFTTCEVRNWDCLYIAGPDNQFYSEDDVKFDQMAVHLDEKKCSLDNSTMDVTCFA
ncbi:uncharacterized protein SRS1_10318 [Sporisorium reilianum f. sp. reilianum]|uniref:DUF7888 domain-containing protein n=1 Tax=Sporisorium reilianum f. sp. reilianum TaxID=72559 RepID=A0A2N8U8D4_9BASI|nr:uncharacterized protein SRS1_10318 [Sporisorium reilianum f. sp. reilianum]